MMMVQRSRRLLLLGACVIAFFVPAFLGSTTIGDSCTFQNREDCNACADDDRNDPQSPSCKACNDSDCDPDKADEFDAIVLAVCWAIALVLVAVYVATMTTTLVFGTAPSAGMNTDGTVHIHLTGPNAAVDGDNIIKQIHRRRGAVMRGERQSRSSDFN